MTQCAGTTLKGQQCKREAREGSRFCSIHFEQPPRSEPAASATDDAPAAAAPRSSDWMLQAALGMAAVAAIVFFRIRR
ncbi:MAG: hypothetical protein AB7T31_12860 [Gemmatimonadales bacterium]